MEVGRFCAPFATCGGALMKAKDKGVFFSRVNARAQSERRLLRPKKTATSSVAVQIA